MVLDRFHTLEYLKYTLMSYDKQIEGIVGSKMSWIMSWGTLGAFLLSLFIYSSLYFFKYKYVSSFEAVNTSFIKYSDGIVIKCKKTNSIYNDVMYSDSLSVSCNNVGVKTLKINKVVNYKSYLNIFCFSPDTVFFADIKKCKKLNVSIIVNKKSIWEIIFLK